MTEVRDVAIVGAGLLGLAAGQALAARGRDVVVLEQAEVGHPGSGSKGSARIFRLGYPDPYYVAAARQARDRWHELEARSGRRILRPAPHLTFGTGLRVVHDAMTAAGAPSQLLQKVEVAERFPALRVDGPALLEPDSAVIAADDALTVLAAGVPEIKTGVRVIRLADDGRQVTLHTTAGAIAARTAIITAGPWSGGLLASVSVAIPGRPTLEQVAYLRPSGQDDAPIFICHGEQAPYGLPVPESRLYKIGIHPSGPATDPDAQNQGEDAWLMGRLADMARRYLPGYHAEPVTTERCVYDNSPDEDFIIDRIGNIVVGCGTSGHGFKFGPLLGERLADLATSPDTVFAEDLLRQRFSIRRFGRLD
jgi:sarcosine oxidase